jgi:hypothetical protein
MLIIGALFLLIPQNALIMLAIFALIASALMGIGTVARKPLIATQVVRTGSACASPNTNR